MRIRIQKFCYLLLLLSLPILSASARPFVLLISQDDLQDPSVSPSDEDYAIFDASSKYDWDEFGDEDENQDTELDPGSWRPIFEPDSVRATNASADEAEVLYYSGVSKMIAAVRPGGASLMEEAASEIEAAADGGNSHAQSAVGFLFDMGMARERSRAKAFTYHHFASSGGNKQSQMALAYTYYRQNMHETAVKLYAELAELAVNSFLVSKDSPVLDLVRIHIGTEENKEALRKSRGEEDEDFQILEYQAQKGNALAMHKIGLYYYFGLRGVRRDHAKALPWFMKAAEKGEPGSMEVLGEIYARGAGVERNYTKSLEWLRLASRQEVYSAYNGMGYLYIKGYGVEKNYTRAKIYFDKAAHNKEAGGHYNLGVMYLKGIGVKKDVRKACDFFIVAASAGQAKAFFQLAKMFHTGVALKKNVQMATTLYKLVAEQGPWSSLSRWALESYLKGDVSTAFLLYSRLGELGYEVAQSNAAWILDKFGEQVMCIGESGLCSDEERHQRSHSLWWQASEQGNEHAALLIGDAYYYGRGTERDYERAAEAYMHAKSQSNAQAMFNLGYMHEHGHGMPLDLHLAKRYYDQALAVDPSAKLPVTLALAGLWVRMNYAHTFMVSFLDALPGVFPKVKVWVEDVIMEEGNATILALFVCLLTVLYFRERQRRNAAVAAAAAEVAAALDRQHGDFGAPMAVNR